MSHSLSDAAASEKRIVRLIRFKTPAILGAFLPPPFRLSSFAGPTHPSRKFVAPHQAARPRNSQRTPCGSTLRDTHLLLSIIKERLAVPPLARERTVVRLIPFKKDRSTAVFCLLLSGCKGPLV